MPSNVDKERARRERERDQLRKREYKEAIEADKMITLSAEGHYTATYGQRDDRAWLLSRQQEVQRELQFGGISKMARLNKQGELLAIAWRIAKLPAEDHHVDGDQ